MVSLIVISYNKKELTRKCLDSIFAGKNKGLIEEVIVVDNASTDGSVEFLKKQKNIEFIQNRKNFGFAKANNIAAQKAKGDILIFLNNDTEVQTMWLEPIVKTFEEKKNIGAVGVKLLFPDGLIQHAGLAFYPDHIARHIYYRARADKPRVNKEREFKAVTAACIAIPKSVFFEVGGFDEEYINGMEDVDLCLKIKQKGYKIIYQPKSVVIHHESVSPGRFNHSQHNADLYMSRWRDVKPDLHEYLKEDGFNTFQILLFDLRAMSYGPNEYGTRPLRIIILRPIFIPLQKVYTLTTLLLKGDFREIITKTKAKLS